MTRNVMIDIETLGTKPGSAVLEIAAATFEQEGGGPLEWFAVEIDLLSCLACGLTVDTGTAAWHLAQGYTGNLRGQPLAEAVMRLHVWMRDKAAIATVWAWGMDFERSMIEAACAAVQSALPWHYYQGADARTIWNVAFPGGKAAKRKHRAADDVAAQITDLQVAIKELKGRNLV